MNDRLCIIGIGASAGGLEPLEDFFELVPTRTNLCFVVIQHLAPDHKSLMDELLARHTNLPIEIIEDGMVPKSGCIYLNPPKKTVLLDEGAFVLVEKPNKKLSFPISSFFSSLAEYSEGKCCAIVLSGTGSDGTNGIKDVKEYGGLILAQDPAQAKFNGMPNSAIASGMVDKVCRVEEMGTEITAFFDNLMKMDPMGPPKREDEPNTQAVLRLLFERTGMDFSAYKPSTVHRRIHRRISLLGYTNIEEYREFLKDTPTEANKLARELLIGVTRFFRDQEAFMALKEKAIPRIVEQNRDTKTIRVWVPACSTGEEAYSIAILIKDYLWKHKLRYDVSIFATDLNGEAIKFAGNRIFPESIVSDVPTEYLETYFYSKPSGFTVTKEIRDMVVFSAHNLIQDPPFNKIDLVSCRNFLIYINDSLQQQVFSVFQYALRNQGILFLGTSESLGRAQDNFLELSKRHKIYMNKESKRFVPKHPISMNIRGSKKAATFGAFTEEPAKDGLWGTGKRTGEIQQAIIQEYAPDTLIVDDQFNLLHSSGNAHRWLTVPVGEISSNLIKMLPEELRISLEVVGRQVLQTGKPMEISSIRVPKQIRPFVEGQKSIAIRVRQKMLLDGEPILLIAFEQDKLDDTEVHYDSIDLATATQEKINILERELRVNQETLQTTIEELESSNEELQSANEELQSSNEELESVNEELYTVNAEYQERNLELSSAKEDLENLIESTNVAMLFLDHELNIRRFTPAIKEILELLPHDIGRNITHFRGKIRLENLMGHIEAVLLTSEVFESRIEDIKNKKYLLKISPFRTKSNEIKGVVLIFLELTKALGKRKALELSKLSLESLRSRDKDTNQVLEPILDNLRDMVCIIDKEGTIEYCNSTVTEIMGLPFDEVDQTNFFDKIMDKKSRDQIQGIIARSTNDNKSGLCSFRINKKGFGPRWMEATIKGITCGSSGAMKYLMTVRDVHFKKLDEISLQKMSLIAEQTNSAVIITDTRGEITYANRAFEKMTGFTEREALGKTPGSLLQGEDSDPKTIKEMSEAIKLKKGFDVNLINYDKTGNKYDVNIKAEPLYDRENNFLGFFSIQNDITGQQEHLRQVHRLNEIIQNQNIKLKEINRSLEEFAYIASHDLKAPVRNIKGMLELIERKGKNLQEERRHRYFEIIKDSSNEINRLIDSLLEYSRSGTVKEDKKRIDIMETLQGIKRTFELELQKIGGELHLETEVDHIEVYPTLFNRLMTNLIGNAVKYRGDKPLKVAVKARPTDEMIIFEVSDNGVGIAEKYFDDIFKIFKVVSPNSDSNGIGLSVCKKIAELHNGTIRLISEPEKGTTFFVELPKH
ncbi:CheR family methyltransferase [Flagellimonas halotolerans]|uniref:CheR family methyltransferase n=1 Tax=Flagellimonas halotolerans TaxID=3112164 RepID=A0ABU6IT09_9FLAO|nr:MULTISPECIES: CheR family methyltransferase [unclassified Allomuricauda]MEC3966226.1 CheR family methyltransferase [Muricauda sp. SYSU M86414]MEC4266088.1 CheR family methyltransferase [Muricauda sp. SYSU M84420]